MKRWLGVIATLALAAPMGAQAVKPVPSGMDAIPAGDGTWRSPPLGKNVQAVDVSISSGSITTTTLRRNSEDCTATREHPQVTLTINFCRDRRFRIHYEAKRNFAVGWKALPSR